MPTFPHGGTHHGTEAVLNNVFGKFGDYWQGWQAAVDEFLDAGDKIVVRGNYHGTYKLTGKSMTAKFAHVNTLKDGKVYISLQHKCCVIE